MAFQVYQALWGMDGLPHGEDREWSIGQKLDRIAATGFDGVDIPLSDGFATGEAVQAANERELAYSLTCYPVSGEDFRARTGQIAAFPVAPAAVNVQPNVRVFTVAEGVAHLEQLVQISGEAGLPITVETHRDRLTTDLRFTLRLLDALPELRLTADLSHFVVGQEFSVWPISEEDDQLVHRVLERSDAFQGRVASREQVQITAGWEIHAPYLELFRRWWRDGFAAWAARAQPGADLVFTCELGPPSYAIVDREGRELSDRWEDALLLCDVAREAWAEVAAG